jgi:hypothetical protein
MYKVRTIRIFIAKQYMDYDARADMYRLTVVFQFLADC